LDKAHRAGFVHRDVKPENIFVIQESDGSRFIKLLDFGFAKQLGSESLTVSRDGIIGTPDYLSPEQISRPEDVDVRSDTWAVGVTAYRMLMGRLPFTTNATGEVTSLYEAILAGRYPRPTELRAELPKDLDDWFGQVIAVAPGARFASLRAASSALQSIAHGYALEATQPARPLVAQPNGKTRSAWQARVFVIGLSIVGIVGVVGLLWFLQTNRRDGSQHALKPRAAPVTPEVTKPAPPESEQLPDTVPLGAAAPEAAAPTTTQPASAPLRHKARVKADPPKHEVPPAAPATVSPLPKDRGF
jgi:serine/threonine-protein kinase